MLGGWGHDDYIADRNGRILGGSSEYEGDGYWEFAAIPGTYLLIQLHPFAAGVHGGPGTNWPGSQ